MAVFDRFKKIMKEAAPTSDRLAAELEAVRKVEADARSEMERLTRLRSTLLDADEPARARNRSDIEDARQRAEDAGLYVAELSKRHLVAAQAEAEQAKLEAYNAAKGKADAAAKMLAKNYPRFVADGLAMVRSLAEAQAEADRVNQDLPNGALPILDPEMVARGTPGMAREVISDEEVEAWTRMNDDRPIDEPFASKVYDCGKGWGKMPDDAQATCLRARFRRLEYRDSVAPVLPLSLASYLRLPAAHGSGVAWGHMQQGGYDQALLATFSGVDAPENVVVRASAVEAARSVKPVAAVPETKVTYELLGYVEATGIAPPQPHYGGRSKPFTSTPLGLGSKRAAGAGLGRR